MEVEPETERDTVAWFRVGVVIASGFAGLALYISDTRPVAYFFLGYALIGAAIMLVFGTWRSSSEVEKVQKRQLKRKVRNFPHGIFRFFLGLVALIVILAIGVSPAFFISNEVHYANEQFLTVYSYLLVGVAFGVCFWVAGIFKSITQAISDFKALRNAEKRAKERRARKKARSL